LLILLLLVVSVKAQKGETWLTQEKVWNVIAIRGLPNLVAMNATDPKKDPNDRLTETNAAFAFHP